MVQLDPDSTERLDAFQALQTGVHVPLPSREEQRRIDRFVQRLLGINAQTMEAQIKTLMLNNRVVDDPAVVWLEPGDVVVLSGALPGLVGAMLRSDSPIKALRQSISGGGAAAQRPEGSREPAGASRPPVVTVKAFNTVLRDYLNSILTYGVFRSEQDG